MPLFKAIRITTMGWFLAGVLALMGLLVVFVSVSTVTNVNSIHTTWDEFQQNRSDKAHALNALRRELGYGGMIHHFKDYLLRKDPVLASRAEEHMGGARAAITRYRSLGTNPVEDRALADIEAMLEAYGNSVRTAGVLIGRGKTAAQVDPQVRVDDGPALAGLDSLSRETSAQEGEQIEYLTKAELVNTLSKALGYGGVIHHFKNYVLRHEDDLRPAMAQDIRLASDALDLYTLQPISSAEVTALDDIRAVMGRYLEAMDTVDTLFARGRSPEQIGQAVPMDDTPALAGLTTLTREVSIQQSMAAQKVDESLHYVTRLTGTMAWVTSLLVGLLAAGALWGLRTLVAAPLGRLAGAMDRLAKGDLNVPIADTDRRNEVGEMARSAQVFKENAIERARAESALKESETRHRAVLDSIVDALITIDDHGTIDSFNPAAERMFGYRADEVVGRNIRMLMPEPYSSEHDGYLERYRETREAHILSISGRELPARRKDGTEFPIELAVTEMFVGDKRMFSGILRDITERRKINRMKNEFISTVSHELRTPLTSIRGSLGLLTGGAMGDLPESTQTLLKIAHNNTERLLELINDILDIEKIESGKMLFRFAAIELMPFLEEASTANQAYADQYGVTIQVVRGLPEAKVYADPHRLTQVLNNLLSNACKFSPRGQVVEIGVSRRGADLRISVADHGPGIPEAFQPNVFGKFTQSDATDTRKAGGTGLGLSITRAIVEKHGGRIGFDSREGQGTTFYVDLPEAPDSMEEVEAEVAPLQVDNGRDTVLIVEDDPDTAEVIRLTLEKSGFNTDVAESGAQARDRLRVTPTPYSAVTLDLELPDENGLALFRELRDRPATRHLPVLVVSGKEDGAGNRHSGGALGVAEWLQKPFEGEQLVAAVKTAVTSIARPRVLHVEDDADLASLVSLLLADMAEVTHAPTLKAARRLLEERNFNLVLLDVQLPDGSGLDLLAPIKTHVMPPQVVIFSGQEVDEEMAGQVSATLSKVDTDHEELASIISSLVRK